MLWPPLGSLRRSVVAIAFVASLAACGRPVTPAELAAYQEHSYAGHSRDEVFKAAVVALKTLGYDVVSVDAASGRVKTAPKVVAVHAARTSAYTAVAASESVAWTLDVASAVGGARVHAVPRLYSAGRSVDAAHMNHAYAEGAFATLYAEIDSNLSRAPLATGTTKTTGASVTSVKQAAPTKNRSGRPTSTRVPGD